MTQIPRKRYKLFQPYALLATLLLLFAGFWLSVSRGIEQRVLEQPGLTVDAISVAGFPSQWRIRLDKPAYRLSGGSLQSETVRITTLVYKPHHHIFWAEGEQAFRDKNGNKLFLTAQDFKGSLLRGPESGNRLSLVLTAPDVQVDPALSSPFTLQADQLEFYTRDLAGQPGVSENFLSITNLSGNTALSLMKGEIAFNAASSGLGDGLDISRLLFRFADGPALPVTLRGQGRLKLDATRHLQGKLDLQIVNLKSLLESLQSNGLVSQSNMNTILLFASLASAASGDAQNTLSLPLQFKGGQMFLGPVMLGPAPQF
ncbi:MAG: DUF2125 domain-containing protein [Parvibaculales bacterium]